MQQKQCFYGGIIQSKHNFCQATVRWIFKQGDLFRQKGPPAPLRKGTDRIFCEREFLKKSPLALSPKTFNLLK